MRMDWAVLMIRLQYSFLPFVSATLCLLPAWTNISEMFWQKTNVKECRVLSDRLVIIAFKHYSVCRQALGLPLEEPGRYVDASYFVNRYDPTNPLYRYDYWGEPKNSEKSKQQRMIDTHNSSIVGKGNVWYETSYEDFIKLKMCKEGLSRGLNN
ncbi:hypothetical protein AAC387_Pa06g1737 [Persea americana]